MNIGGNGKVFSKSPMHRNVRVFDSNLKVYYTSIAKLLYYYCVSRFYGETSKAKCRRWYI